MPRPPGPRLLLCAFSLAGVILVTPSFGRQPGLSSGSGAGTGTGSQAGGLGATGTGREAPGLGSTGSGREALPRQRPGGLTVPGLPLRGPRLAPLETLGDPALGLPLIGANLSEETIRRMARELYGRAREISDPADRSEALERAARIQIRGARDLRSSDDASRLEEARLALLEAFQALRMIGGGRYPGAPPEARSAPVRSVYPNTTHDVRSQAIIETTLLLADAYQDQGLAGDLPSFGELDDSTPAARSIEDRLATLRTAFEVYDLAGRIAYEIVDPSWRSEALARVSEFEARAATEIALGRRGFADPSPGDAQGAALPVGPLIEESIARASEHARRIGSPVWRDRALLIVADQAALSGAYAAGVAIARLIPQGLPRAEALIHLAEAQARAPGMSPEATLTYNEAARAIAGVLQDDQRVFMTEILISSLNLSGRFADARAAIQLFRNPIRRMEAMGVIAEEMGRRGLDTEARDWIVANVPPADQARLLRRVIKGAGESIEQYRTSIQAAGGGFDGDSPPSAGPPADLPMLPIR